MSFSSTSSAFSESRSDHYNSSRSFTEPPPPTPSLSYPREGGFFHVHEPPPPTPGGSFYFQQSTSNDTCSFTEPPPPSGGQWANTSGTYGRGGRVVQFNPRTEHLQDIPAMPMSPLRTTFNPSGGSFDPFAGASDEVRDQHLVLGMMECFVDPRKDEPSLAQEESPVNVAATTKRRARR